MDDLSGWTNSVKPDRPYHDCQEVEDELERLKDADKYEVTKRALQASEKLNRALPDHIVTLRILVELSNEWQRPL